MFENIMNLLKKITKKEEQTVKSKDAAKERLHLVLMQDRANVSADFLDLMKQEIIEVIKKYIDIDESAMDVRLTNKENSDVTNGAPALYANIPIVSIKDENKNAINISYFKKLINVNIGDSVYVYYKGVKYNYEITNKYDIEKTGKADVLLSNSDKYITLITCNPNRKGYQVVLIGKLFEQSNY